MNMPSKLRSFANKTQAFLKNFTYSVYISSLKMKVRNLNSYLPLFYLEQVKRPGKKYFLTYVIYTDLAILLLSSNWWLQSQFLVHALAIFFLLISFWCVYEIGYYENDTIAERYEAIPVLSPAYKSYKNSFNSWRAYGWAAVLSVPSIYLLEFSSTGSWALEPLLFIYISQWVVFLSIVRLTFLVYNHLDKQTRVWLYPFLQIQKYLGYLFFIPINPIGLCLFLAQILASSSSYLIYRYGGNWPEALPNHFIRLCLFILLIFFLCIGLKDYSLIFDQQVALILTYCIFRARHEIARLISSAYFVSHEKRQ